jgi:hypothetical protein
MNSAANLTGKKFSKQLTDKTNCEFFNVKSYRLERLNLSNALNKHVFWLI